MWLLYSITGKPKFVSLSWFLRLYHFYGLFTTYLLYEEVMSVRLYANRQLPMKVGWWDAPLLGLLDLAEAVYMILTVGGNPLFSQLLFLSKPIPNRFPHRDRIITQPQQSTNKNLLCRLHTFTLLLPTSTCFTPESPFFFFLVIHQYISRNYGSKNSAIVAIITDTTVASMQPSPSQPYLSKSYP